MVDWLQCLTKLGKHSLLPKLLPGVSSQSIARCHSCSVSKDFMTRLPAPVSILSSQVVGISARSRVHIVFSSCGYFCPVAFPYCLLKLWVFQYSYFHCIFRTWQSTWPSASILAGRSMWILRGFVLYPLTMTPLSFDHARKEVVCNIDAAKAELSWHCQVQKKRRLLAVHFHAVLLDLDQ